MTGPWGPVFGPLDLDIDTGGVTVLTAPAGSGRTALLMTVAGRMKPATGTITVFGRSKARDIFAVSALAGIEQLDSVFESVTVRDLITEQIRWDAPWYRLVRRAGEAELETVCRPVFGDLPLPRLTEYVEELDELNRLLLRIALANTARPPLLVVANLDQVTSDRNRETLIARLVDLGEQQTVVTATVNELPTGLGIRKQLPVEHLERANLTRTGHGRHEKGDN
ncbi:ATP-binding cassette domain-containing protein [Mycobacterium celatum]|uniref:ABC transporter domain-containing protein n=2 Tax=Mycobacterium celatum TaxID=28045 RepID=A0A1X1RV86_MYCCE|nr:ATP-binding cassette domain-containing protein [Mycobacterium celatum]ORV18302.1 hypothetical protein AWB95_05225 [Mycobacterium celatum]PIB73891.1 hypothetical protein CQY23_22490 [Mycobacterium celatum]